MSEKKVRRWCRLFYASLSGRVGREVSKVKTSTYTQICMIAKARFSYKEGLCFY